MPRASQLPDGAGGRYFAQFSQALTAPVLAERLRRHLEAIGAMAAAALPP